MCDPAKAISNVTDSVSSALGTDGSGGGLLGGVSDVLGTSGKKGVGLLQDPTSMAVVAAVAAYYGIPADAVSPSMVDAAASAGAVDSSAAAATTSAMSTAGITDASVAGTSGISLTGGTLGSTVGSGATGLTGGDLLAGSSLGSGTAASGGAGLSAGSLLSGSGLAIGVPALASGGSAASSLIPGISNAGLLGAGLNIGGSILNANAAKSAADTQAAAQLQAAQIAADAAKFRPVGVTTGFGSSQFGYAPNGNVASASYQLTPEMAAQRNALLASSNGLLNQATGAQAATVPMATAAQNAMQLGNGYLSTDPQAQAAKYYADQQAILAPSRASDMAALQAQMQAQGRGGLAIGGGVGGQGAANPQLQALLNAQQQQNTQLAANATQGGMQYAQFGAGMVGTGSDLLNSMYGTQTAAFNPYKTALGGAQTVEGLGQNSLTMGMNMGSTVSSANANAGSLLGQGMANAAATQAPSNAYSPWGALLSGAGNAVSNSGYKYDPMTGKAL